jgi:hypothetical protein
MVPSAVPMPALLGALIIGDNVNLDPNHGYLDYVHAPENGYVSTPLPLDKGLELAVRV